VYLAPAAVSGTRPPPAHQPPGLLQELLDALPTTAHPRRGLADGQPLGAQPDGLPHPFAGQPGQQALEGLPTLGLLGGARAGGGEGGRRVLEDVPEAPHHRPRTHLRPDADPRAPQERPLP
jgi:hypothetical protein